MKKQIKKGDTVYSDGIPMIALEDYNPEFSSINVKTPQGNEIRCRVELLTFEK